MFLLQARLWPRGWVELSIYSSMTAVLEGGEWSAAHAGRNLPLGKTRYPLYRKLSGPQGRYWRAENRTPPGLNPRTVQSVISRCTVWATRHTSWLDTATEQAYAYICLTLSYITYIVCFLNVSATFVTIRREVHHTGYNTNFLNQSTIKDTKF